MEYVITSHDDATRSIAVEYKGYQINVNYPEDADTYGDLTQESIALLVEGVIRPYASMPDYTPPAEAPSGLTEWF